MAGNQAPIYTRVGDIQGGVILTGAAGDYTGANSNNSIVFQADPVNGGFVQRLRFKPILTNPSTVARIYINEGVSSVANSIPAPSTAPSAVAVANSGGTLQTGSYYAVVQAIDQWGGVTPFSPEGSVILQTANTNTITWTWPYVTGAVGYRLFIGPQPGGEIIYFNTANVNSYTQNTATINLSSNFPNQGSPKDFLTTNMFYGELSLPSVNASATAAQTEVDYPMNLPLPPGYHIVVGLGTSVSNGWMVTAVGGKY
jgi:hypothetical protein